jgi:rhamnosyltransferase
MIGAGIVTYNPSMSDIEENLTKVLEQVPEIVIVDNHSSNISDLQRYISNFPTVFLIENISNRGIATALNQIFEFAKVHGWDFVLTLDDDSIVPYNMISSFNEIITNTIGSSKIGIICPKLIDRTTRKPLKNRDIVYGGITCITSGSLTSIEAWEATGGFLEWLFIDSVDFDFSLRLDSLGFQILEAKNVVMEHSIGTIINHKILGIEFEHRYYSSFRKYYQERNSIYMRSRYHHSPLAIEILRHINHLALSIIFDKNKLANIRSLRKGFKDGIYYARHSRHDYSE